MNLTPKDTEELYYCLYDHTALKFQDMIRIGVILSNLKVMYNDKINLALNPPKIIQATTLFDVDYSVIMGEF